MNRIRNILLAGALTIALLSCASFDSFYTDSTQTPVRRPNILLIVADDLGYTDLSSFGGEIRTPNLDKLAYAGLRLGNFHTSPACSPTRSMLLTGADNHIAGLGAMAEGMADNQRGQPGYEGVLNSRVVSIATLLRDAGYHTYMSGKWHLGSSAARRPEARGFEQSFALLEGGADSHFASATHAGPQQRAHYVENGKAVMLPEDFYSSKNFTEKLITYIDNRRNDKRPFFAYLAFSAPHWPLQAPDHTIDSYRNRYDQGYGVLVQQRFYRAQVAGVLPEAAALAKSINWDRSWESLSEDERKIAARKMEVYAAVVETLDYYVGRLIDYLDRQQLLENTMIVFLSDNGAAGDQPEKWGWGFSDWVAAFNNEYTNIGREGSFVAYGPDWARAASLPFKGMKGEHYEGGVRTAAFITMPASASQRRIGRRRDSPVTQNNGQPRDTIQRGRVSHALLTVKDITPTLLVVAGVKHPGTRYKGRDVYPPSGKSLLPLLRGQVRQIHSSGEFVGSSLLGQIAIRQDHWKLLRIPPPLGSGHWQLYDLSVDPGEHRDVSQYYPDQLQTMINYWHQYRQENGVILPRW